MHCLLADAKEHSDLLPRPAVRASVADLERLKALGQLSQCSGSTETCGWILPAGRLGECNLVTHIVNIC
jgi:hypothetical protein